MIKTKKFEDLPQITSISPSGKILVIEQGIDKIISFEDFSNLPATNDVWNNVNTTFTASEVNVTDTQSAADSKLLDLKVNTVSKFVVRKDGNLGIGVTNPAARLDISDTVLAGSGSLAGSILNLAQTWNTTGNPIAIKLNVTNTASGATSNLLDLQVGGVSQFNVTKAGVIILNDNFGLRGVPSSGWVEIGGKTNILAGTSKVAIWEHILGLVQLANNGSFSWSSLSSAANGSTDLSLVRDAAGTLAQRNGVNPQAFRLYNTYTDTSNYERGYAQWSSNAFIIGYEFAGTGNNGRIVVVRGSNSGGVRIDNGANIGFEVRGGNFLALLDNTYDIGANAATRPRTGYFGTSIVTPTIVMGGSNQTIGLSLYGIDLAGNSLSRANSILLTSSTASATAVNTARIDSPSSNLIEFRSADDTGFASIGALALSLSGQSLSGSAATSLLDLSTTWNTTGAPTAIKLNVTNTASGAASNLLDLQVGGVSMFKVEKTGNIIFSSASAYNNAIHIGSYGLGIGSASYVAFSSNVNGSGGSDLFISRKSSANLRLGLADAAAPVAQTLSVQSVVAGTTNTAGANLTITGSQGTGTGTGGSIIFQTAQAGSSGSTQNALSAALTIDSNRNMTIGGPWNDFTFNVPAGGGSRSFSIKDGSTTTFQVGTNGMVVLGYLAMGASTPSPDVLLQRDAANTLGLRNGVNPQTFRLYNTYTDATTFERLNIKWDTNVFKIGTEKGGSGGTARAMELQTDGTTRMSISGTGIVSIDSIPISRGIGTNTDSIAIGGGLTSNTSGTLNIAFGTNALLSNTTGPNNSAFGLYALWKNTTGSNNLAVAYGALAYNTTGNNNTAIGYNALLTNTDGTYNSAVGTYALRLNTTASYNSALGFSALYSNTTGSMNSAVGYNSLYSNTTGSSNLAIGFEAGRYITDGSTTNDVSNNSIFLGANTKAAASGQTNQIVIGDSAIGIGSNSVVLGNNSILTTALKGSVGIGTTTPAARLDIADTTLAGSGSLAGSVLNLAQTWNTTGAPTAIKLNVTNTASGAASNLLDLQVGGASKFSVDKNGGITIPASNTGAPQRLFATSIEYTFPAGISITNVGRSGYWNWDALAIRSDAHFGFSSSTTVGTPGTDTKLFRDAEGVLAQRNGVNPQTFRLYNTYTDANTFERLNIKWDTNVLKIGTEKGTSGGTARAMELQTDGVTRLTIATNGLATFSGTVSIGAGAQLNLNQGKLYSSSRAGMSSPADGIWLMYNDAENNFNRLQFGGTTSSFPAIKRNGAAIQIRLADDSANAALETAGLTVVGSASVSGHFSATTKSFLIPHPTKPDKKLQYACLEGPENGVYIRGKTNEPIILLPDYWSELVDADSITVTVTPIGKPQQLFVVSQNSTSVEIGNVDGLYNYLIFAERKDVNKLQTEI